MSDHILQTQLPSIQQVGLYLTTSFNQQIAFLGHLIAVASDDSSIKMIDVSSNTINNLAGHDGPCNSVQFDLPGSYLVSAGSDCSLRIWN